MSVPRTVEPSGIADEGFPRKAGSVVPANVAPNEPQIGMRWLREKPTQVSKTTLVTKKITHGQPLAICRNCGFIADRDSAGAINIWLRLLYMYVGEPGSPLSAPAVNSDARGSGGKHI